MVSQQTRRQLARREARLRARKAREEQQQRMVEQKAREHRLGKLGVEVAEALALARCEQVRAGHVLQKMTTDEGVSLTEAARWCGDLTPREASRLRRLATEARDRGRSPATEDRATN